MREIRLPEHLDVGEGYGTVAWNVRAIWETYAGWFHHRSTTELYAVPPGAGRRRPRGAPPAPTRSPPPPGARLDAGEPVAALHLTDLVLAVEPTHAGGARWRPTPTSARSPRARTSGSGPGSPGRSSELGGAMNSGRVRLRGHRVARHRRAPAASATRSPRAFARRGRRRHRDGHPRRAGRLRHRPRRLRLPTGAR